MLLQFSVTNHRSIKDTAIISLKASTDKSLSDCLVSPDDKKQLVPVLALYGANAAGKSNVLHALLLMREMVCGRYAKLLKGESLPQEPFAFTDPPEQPEPTDYDYEYRVDTDVITPVTLYAGSEINPDSPATVSFSINGSTYRMNNIVIPSGDSQIAWVKWHTPSEPQDITIYVSTNKGSLSQSTIHAKVVDLSGNDPPDPKATDTMGSWSASSIPSRETKTYAAWSVWWAKWHPYWVWHSTGKNTGYWVDDGWYDYFRDNYSASMTATTRIEPDEKVPTASGDLMKSGYGVTNTVTATVSTSAPLSHYTYGQTAVSYFPEFGYGTYWRLLERLTSGTTARFQFAKNIYSTYNQRVHFSPVWFPDGSYTVNTHVMDIWTPAGMLAMNLTDDVTISGSLYDDWHIAPGNP